MRASMLQRDARRWLTSLRDPPAGRSRFDAWQDATAWCTLVVEQLLVPHDPTVPLLALAVASAAASSAHGDSGVAQPSSMLAGACLVVSTLSSALRSRVDPLSHHLIDEALNTAARIVAASTWECDQPRRCAAIQAALELVASVLRHDSDRDDALRRCVSQFADESDGFLTAWPIILVRCASAQASLRAAASDAAATAAATLSWIVEGLQKLPSADPCSATTLTIQCSAADALLNSLRLVLDALHSSRVKVAPWDADLLTGLCRLAGPAMWVSPAPVELWTRWFWCVLLKLSRQQRSSTLLEALVSAETQLPGMLRIWSVLVEIAALGGRSTSDSSGLRDRAAVLSRLLLPSTWSEPAAVKTAPLRAAKRSREHARGMVTAPLESTPFEHDVVRAVAPRQPCSYPSVTSAGDADGDGGEDESAITVLAEASQALYNAALALRPMDPASSAHVLEELARVLASDEATGPPWCKERLRIVRQRAFAMSLV